MVFVATKVQISRRREESESGLDPNLARATHTSRCRLILAGVIRAAWRLLPGEKVLRFLFFSLERSRVYQAVTLAQLEPQYQRAGQLLVNKKAQDALVHPSPGGRGGGRVIRAAWRLLPGEKRLTSLSFSLHDVVKN